MRSTFSSLLRSVAIFALFTGAAFAVTPSAAPATPFEARYKAAGEPDAMLRDQPEQSETQSLQPVLSAVQSGNYAFSTTTTASLTDMSSGTTTLVPADQDDVASAVTLIGFDFYFQGARQDRFSVNSNGTLRFGAATISTTLYDPLAQAGQALITAYGADQRTHAGNGKVHFKVIGAAPNRVLVVEWLNMQADFNAGGTADLTYQVRLTETSGTIEFVYGSMSMSANGAADPNSQSPQFGFSSNNAVDTVGSITAAQSGTPAPTFSGASAAPVNNLYVAGTIPVLTSAADGARRSFLLAPPAVNPPGGPLTFTAVSATGMTLNWTDSSNEQGYAIYQSTDGTNYTFFSTAAQNATSLVVSGLLQGTNYFWRVLAVSEGATASLQGAQTTATATPNTSLGSGLWSAPGTWSTGIVPTTNDAVTIASGTTVTIDTAAVAYSVSVAGTLQFEQTTARSLTVGTDATVQNGGILQSNPAGTQTGHNLSIAGNLTNNGTLDFSTNADTAGAIVTFTGASNATFGGTGVTTDIRQITVNKGTTFAAILELMPTNFSVRGVTTDTVVGGWLVMSNGTLKVSGTFSGTSRVFAAAAYTIPATSGFWLNNPNYTIAGQAGSATLNGLLRVTQGTFNVGTATGNAFGFNTGSTVVVEGGSINATGRFGVGAAGNAISYTQSGGTITVCTIGNASATLGSFDLGTSLNSAITVSGGTIVNQLNATAIDYRNQAGGGIAGITGGTLQLGNAASGAAKNFNLRGVLPNVVVTNTSANHTATMSTTLVNFNNISLNITINTGATFNTGNVLFLMGGATLTNNGTFTANGASSNFIWFDIGGGPPQTYTGTGVTTVPVTTMSVQTASSVTFTSTNQFITNRINLFQGTLVNADHLTLGTGGATTGIVQIGNTTTPTAAGTFDAAPTFNLGTGGEIISYLRTTGARNTGPEINPTRALTNFTFDDNDPAHSLTLNGGDLTVTGTTTLSNGRVITGSNTFIIGAAGTLTRTNGYVDGNLRKTFAAAASRTYEVGTANGYSPVVVNVTAGTFPADVTVAAIQGTAPGIQPASDVIGRYWTIVASGITADLTFSYLDPTDIPVSVSEANLHVLYLQTPPSGYVDEGGTINTAANTATVTGVTSFSTFTLGVVEADLSITNTDGVTTATAGGSVTYTITASNGGTVGNPSALVSDTFPAGLTCSTTCTGANGGVCTAGPIAGNINDTVNLPSGGSVTYAVTCAISASASGSISNTATVSGGAVADGNLANNSATDTDTVGASADLAITKTDGVTTATAGGSVTYTIVASNAGPSDASGATVADTFPASLTCTWTCSGAGGGTCTASGSGNINSLINLPSGGSTIYTASCTVSAAATGTLSNTATVTAPAGVSDPTPGNNSATDSDTIAATADLSITKTDGVTSVNPGSSVTYTITASNSGPSSVTGATVADTFPATETCTWTCGGAGGGVCTASGSGNIADAVNLPAGGSATFVASCAVSPQASGSLVNTATVTAPGGVTDPTPGNNSATDTDTVLAAVALTVTASDGHDYARYGQMLNYLLKVSNAGPLTASDIAVSETLSPDFVASSAHWICIGADDGASCTPAGTGPLSDSGVVIPAARSLTWLVTVNTQPDAPDDTADNTFVVTSASDPNSPYQKVDSDILVIFRDGFEFSFGDGTGDAPNSVNVAGTAPVLSAVAAPFVAGQSLAFDLPAAAGSSLIDSVLVARAVDGTGFRVERLNYEQTAPRIRIVSSDILGIETASAWIVTSNGAHIVLGLADDGGTQAILETEASEMTARLSQHVREVYQVQAASDAAMVQ